ncbi:hypothetical protein D3C87_1137570 [compost metagenome]
MPPKKPSTGTSGPGLPMAIEYTGNSRPSMAMLQGAATSRWLPPSSMRRFSMTSSGRFFSIIRRLKGKVAASVAEISATPDVPHGEIY